MNVTEFLARPVQERRALWLEALESGRFPQSRGKWKDGGGMCAMMVLAHISGLRVRAVFGNLVIPPWEHDTLTRLSHNGDIHLGLLVGMSRAQHESVIMMNDGGCGFREIAGWLRAQWGEQRWPVGTWPPPEIGLPSTLTVALNDAPITVPKAIALPPTKVSDLLAEFVKEFTVALKV